MTPRFSGNRLLTRRLLLVSGAAAPASTLGQLATNLPPPPPQLETTLVKEFVGKSHGDLAAVRSLAGRESMLVRAAFDQGAGDWETGLGAASHMGRRDIARFLIDNGARVDAFAIFMLGEVTAGRALLAAFPAIHMVPGPHGIPLLGHAIVGKKEAFDTFGLLLEAGADVNAKTFRGITPLMTAAAMNQPEMVRLLIDRGANPAVRTPEGLTALDFARRQNFTAVAALLK
jgi:hypothetical protein